jgi:hypothetical protein
VIRVPAASAAVALVAYVLRSRRLVAGRSRGGVVARRRARRVDRGLHRRAGCSACGARCVVAMVRNRAAECTVC